MYPNDGWESPAEEETTQERRSGYDRGYRGRGGRGRGARGRCYEKPAVGENDGWQSPAEDESESWNSGRNQYFTNRDFRGRGRGRRSQETGRYQDSDWRSRAEDEPEDQGSGNRSFGRGGFQSRDERGRRGRGGRNLGNNSSSMTVKTQDVGKVIGKGGSKIRELQDESGAHIKIEKENQDDFGATTNITLSGSSEAQSKAKELIEDYLQKPRNTEQRNDNRRNEGTSDRNRESDSAREDPYNINFSQLLEECKKAEAEKWSKMEPIKKDFYIEDPEVANMSPEEVQRFRKMNNNISVSAPFGGDYTIPNPIQTFEQCFGPYPDILEEIRKQGFERPSPIQCQAWPVLLQGHDLIGIAQTGTGKTLAFLLPALIHIEHQPVPRSERRGANVLIMAPTRELALQIEEEVNKYSYREINCVCVYGGASRRDQIDIVTKGVDIIIATPGRLNDLAQAGVIDLSSITYLVLDEADRMLDLGFEPQIRLVMYDIRPDRQTIMTSATWPEGVRRLATKYMNNPVQVFIGTLDLAAVHTVTQKIVFTEEDDKFELLTEFIDNMEEKDKIIVFVGRKARADHISSDLILKGVECRCIHGSVVQCDREQAIEDLKTGDAQILIATDVASRGIDISDVTHIINYDFPHNIEEYVHRVGRTGRAGKTGEAISFITRENWGHAKELIGILEEADQEVPEELMHMASRFDAFKERKAAENQREKFDRYNVRRVNHRF